MQEKHPILVVGGTGKTGRRVAERLERLSLPVRVVSRSSAVPFDWNDPKTWNAALDGVEAAYVTYSPDLAVPAAAPAIEEFSRLAHARGLQRLVLLSGRGEEGAQRCERILLDRDPDWTVVRASWFAQNFNEGFMLDPLREGTLTLPAGDVAEPFIDVDDIADVAVAALTEDGHAGRIYEVTGPRALTFADAVEEISRASGRELRYEQVPLDAFVGALRAQGVPGPVVELMQFLFGTVLDGRNARPSDGVRRALGRAPRDFATYAREAAATGVWSAATAGRSAS